MTKYDYLIIGGGMTAASAVHGIREVDPSGKTALFSMEPKPPYNRPPLSKKLWQGKSPESIWNKLPQGNLEVMLHCQVVQLDPYTKTIRTEDGAVHSYQKLLLATGGSPRRLPFAPEETNYYRTIDDYHTVRSWTGKGARIGIIGGGFIGSELASSLTMLGEQTVMVFPEDGIGSRIYPKDLSDYLTGYYQDKGVEVHTGVEIQSIQRRGSGFLLQGNHGPSIPVDHIIAGIGILPNTELAKAGGVTIAGRDAGGGILVDAYLRTNQSDIFAAGDVASFYNPALQTTVRVEHADNATSMGHTAGLNMAGQAVRYDHLPSFYSDLFDHGYEAVGELDPRLQVEAEWIEPYRKGVLYYLREGVIRGVLLWNVWEQVETARALIQDRVVYRSNALFEKSLSA